MNLRVPGQGISYHGPQSKLSYKERQFLSLLPQTEGWYVLQPWLSSNLNMISLRELVCPELGSAWFMLPSWGTSLQHHLFDVTNQWQTPLPSTHLCVLREQGLKTTHVCFMKAVVIIILEEPPILFLTSNQMSSWFLSLFSLHLPSSSCFKGGMEWRIPVGRQRKEDKVLLILNNNQRFAWNH